MPRVYVNVLKRLAGCLLLYGRVLKCLEVSWKCALEYFEIPGTLTEVKSKRISIIVPYPNRFITFAAFPASKAPRDYREILTVKFGPLTIGNMLHHRCIWLSVLGNSYSESPHRFTYT